MNICAAAAAAEDEDEDEDEADEQRPRPSPLRAALAAPFDESVLSGLFSRWS